MTSPERVPVVILCGGKGTRLGAMSTRIPKPLAPVGGMPISWHIMKSYAHFGFKDFVLCLGYKGDLIREFYTQGTIDGEPAGSHSFRDPDWRIEFAETGAETGTGGRVHRVRPLIEERGSRRFLLTYGDGVSDVSIPAVLSFHEAKGRLATVTGVHPRTSFGVIHQQDGVVTHFEEKPRLDVVINGGFFVLERGVFDYVEDDGAFEQEPMRRLAAAQQLAVFEHDGFWQCMDTQKERMELDELWQGGAPPWAPWAKKLAGHARQQAPTSTRFAVRSSDA